MTAAGIMDMVLCMCALYTPHLTLVRMASQEMLMLHYDLLHCQ